MHSNGGRWHKSLTPKQERFCLEYLKTGNASEAYRRAYNAQKMKPETINRKAKELMDNGKIAARLAELARVMAENAGLTVEKTLREVARIVHSDPRRLFDTKGRLLPISELPAEVAASVASMEVVTSRVPGSDPVKVEYTTKIKLWDKNSAIDKAMKHLGLFKEDNKQGAPSVVIIAATPIDERL